MTSSISWDAKLPDKAGFVRAIGRSLGAMLIVAGCAQQPVPVREPAPFESPPQANLAPRAGQLMEVNGGRLFVDSTGRGDTVILLHEFALDARMWDAQFLELARRYRVVRYDLRGFGRSSAPAEPYSHVEDLRRLMTALGIRQAHLVGASMGGRVAIDFALAYPSEVQSLVLVDASLGGWEFSKSFSATFSDTAQSARRGDWSEARRRWLDQPLYASARAQPDLNGRLKQMIDEYGGAHFIRPDPVVATQSAARQLARIKALTLVIVGERDAADFQEIAAKLVREIPSARKVVIPGVGHLANMEAPARFNRVVLDFFDRGKPIPIESLTTGACVDAKTKRPVKCE